MRELGPSLAASVAGGGVFAAHYVPEQISDACNEEEEECIVVLFRPATVTADALRGGGGSLVGNNLTAFAVYGDDYGDGDGIDGDVADEKGDDDDAGDEQFRGLTFLPNGPVGGFGIGDRHSRALRVLDASSGLLVAAAGFAPDAEHLLGVAAAKVAVRRSAYASSSSLLDVDELGGVGSVKNFCDPHRLVREDLSEMISDAAASDGGRPFGVQMLVVGRSTLAGRMRSSKRTVHRNPALEVYTVDPSGGWRHHCSDADEGGGGVTIAAIGRKAEAARKHLVEQTPVSGWRGALDRAVQAAVGATVDREESVHQSQDAVTDETVMADDEIGASASVWGKDCIALVVFARGSPNTIDSRCAAVHPSVLEGAYRRCIRHNLKEEENKKGRTTSSSQLL